MGQQNVALLLFFFFTLEAYSCKVLTFAQAKLGISWRWYNDRKWNSQLATRLAEINSRPVLFWDGQRWAVISRIIQNRLDCWVLSVMLHYRIRRELQGAALHVARQQDPLPAIWTTIRIRLLAHFDISEVKWRILVFYRHLLPGRINYSERVYKRESKQPASSK